MKHNLRTSAFSLLLLLGLQTLSGALTLPKTVAFGSDKTGLATVGYTLLNPTTFAVDVARTTTGVVEVGGGVYAASVTAAGNEVIKWDSGETTPIVATDNFIVPADTPGTGTLLTRLPQALVFSGANVNAAAQNLPATYPLAANDETALGYLLGMIAPNGGTTRFLSTALALAPTGSGSGSDPWATLLTAENTAGSFGAFVKGLMPAGNVTVGGYASGQDPASLVLAGSVGSGVTVQQALAASMRNLKSYQSALNTPAHTRTVIYFVPGTTDAAAAAGTGTPLFTATVHYATDSTTILYTTYN